MKPSTVPQALLLALLLLTSAGAAPAPGAEKTYKGYYIEAKTKGYGAYKVIACPDAIRVDGITGGFTCVSKAPQWNVVVYRLDSRTFADLDYRRWCMLNCIALNSDQFVDSKPLSVMHGLESGRKTVTYYYNSREYSGNFGIYQSEKVHSDVLQRARVKCLDWPEDMHPSSVIGKLFGLPPLKGIALEISHAPPGSSSYSDIGLSTSKIVKSDAIAASKFAVPPGLKPVAVSDKLFFNPHTKDVINEIMGAPDGN